MQSNHAITAPASVSSHMFNQSILRAYDIRGIVGETLSTDDAYAIGRGFASIIITRTGKTNPTITSARDGRLSSPDMLEALNRGMVDAGANVIDTGLGPTPMLYYSVHHFAADGGIMVTGSHNPPTHNGFKMTIGTKPFYGDDIIEIGEIAKDGDWATGNGSVKEISIFDEYVNRLLEGLNKSDSSKELTVVWDAGNGAAGEAMQALTAKLPGKHILLFADIDGTFPNHHPDPTVPENLVDLQAAVAAEKADFGVAFDGDGDRIGAVDSTGRIIWGDQLLMFFAREILSRKPNSTIIADVKASQTLFDDVAANGGNPVMWKTGHSLIKAKMAETKSEIAGEMSGHIFFSDGYYGFDDGLYAAVRLMDIAMNGDDSITQMRGNLPKVFNTPEIRIECEESRKFAIVEEIRSRLKQSGEYEVNEVDGVRVKVGNGWWLARASNTQSAIIARCEAGDEQTLTKLRAMVTEQLAQSGINQKI